MTNEEILNKIHDIKLYNVSYRNYFCMIKNYIVCIYPFVTEIIEFHREIEKFVEQKSFLNSDDITEIMWFHHIDYTEGKCNFDPCLLYEEITGDYVHTHSGPVNNGCSKDYYQQKSLEFNNKITSYFRKEKLKKLNIIK